MQILLNGKKSETEGSTILELIAEKDFDTEGLIVELNFNIVKKDDWAKTVLKDDDKIEFVTFVGGG